MMITELFIFMIVLGICTIIGGNIYIIHKFIQYING